MRRILTLLLLALGLQAAPEARAFSFVHPGMAQSREDLDAMKEYVLRGGSPWKEAFEHLRESARLDFEPTLHDYVVKGPNVKNITGVETERSGQDFRASRTVAYDCALMWYITGDRRYAAKAIEILDAWSHMLRQIDGNDARLSVGMDGYYYLNAAEILRHTDSGWTREGQDAFLEMVMQQFYPVIRSFSPEMNGNWGASMIGTMLCIGIYADREDIFEDAVKHFLNGSGNDGVVKYVYPNGQCQEATRDWGHVQMGLGFQVRIANVAETQGIDLYGIAQDRIARGYEYAMRYLLTGEVDQFGAFTNRSFNRISDSMEPLYQHYLYRKGIRLPYVERAVLERTRKQPGTEFLTATRAGRKEPRKTATLPEFKALQASRVGAPAATQVALPADYELVRPGESVQEAVDRCAAAGKWVVLDEGEHILPATLRLPSHAHIMGKGLKTVLMAAPQVNPAIVNAGEAMEDVVFRNLLIEGEESTAAGSNPNMSRRRRVANVGVPPRGAVVFRSAADGIRNVTFENVSLWRCSRSGVQIVGGKGIRFLRCDISDNGGGVPSAKRSHHNVLLTYCSDVTLQECRLGDSLCGSGLYVVKGKGVVVEGCELARNAQYGAYFADSDDILVKGCTVEGNDVEGIFQEKLAVGCSRVRLQDNLVQLNVKDGVPRY